MTATEHGRMDLPDSPVGQRLSWVFEVIAGAGNVSEDDIRANFAPAFVESLGVLQIQQVFESLAATGPFSVGVIDPVGPYVLRGVVRFGERIVNVGCQVDQDPPHRVTFLRFRPAREIRRVLTEVSGESKPIASTIRDHFEPWLDRTSIGGIVVGAFVRGETCIQNLGDVGSGDVFEVGSVTKPITATLLAEMVSAGEVHLDDELQTYVGGEISVPKDQEESEICLLHLATHAAGLPRIPTDWRPSDPRNPYADLTAEKLIDSLQRTELHSPVGTRYTYSNFGYALLGQALSSATKKPFAELIRDRVCHPLEMHETTVGGGHDLTRRRAQGHGLSGNPMPHWDRPAMSPAGGVESTASDMLRFIQAQLDPDASAIGDAIKLTQQPVVETGTNNSSGLGWQLIRMPDDSSVFWHTGMTGGFTSAVFFWPSRACGVVALSNTTSNRPDQETAAVLAALANR